MDTLERVLTTRKQNTSRDLALVETLVDYLNAIHQADPEFSNMMVQTRHLANQDCPVLTGAQQTAGLIGILNGFLTYAGYYVRVAAVQELPKLSLTASQKAEYYKTARVHGYHTAVVGQVDAEAQLVLLEEKLKRVLANRRPDRVDEVEVDGDAE